MTDPTVDPATEDALAELAAEDAGAAELARAAVGWLTGGEATLDEVLLRDLVEFLYYQLPVK